MNNPSQTAPVNAYRTKSSRWTRKIQTLMPTIATAFVGLTKYVHANNVASTNGLSCRASL